MAGEYQLSVIMSAQDKASNVVQSFLSNLGPVGKTVAVVGATLIGVGVASVKMAGDFQSSMVGLVTGAGESRSNLKMVSDGILNMAVTTGTSTSKLAEGMFTVESAGYHGAAGLQVLQTAAEGAKSGNADLKTVSNAVVTVMTDYHLKANQSAEAMNGLTATVSNGNTHLQDLASAMGSVLPIASKLHVSFPQVGGAMATMTNAGIPAQQAAQNIAHVLTALSAPSSVAVKSMTSVGLTAQQVSDTLSKQGLTAAMQEIEDHIGKKFPAGSVQATTALKNIMGGITGLKLDTATGGASMAIFKGNVDAISGAMNKGGTSVNGFNDVQGTFNFKMQQAQESTEVLMIKLGQYLIPIVEQVGATVAGLIANFATWVTTSGVIPGTINTIHDAINGTITVVQNIVKWFNTWKPIISDVAGVITIFFLPAIIKVGVESAISGAKMAASFIANMITTGVQAVINAAKVTASFIASMVQAGAQAWIQGGKVVAGFVSSIIATGTQAVVNAAKVTASFVASMATAGAQAVTSAAKVTASFIASMISTGTQAVLAAAKVTASFVASMVMTAAKAVVSAAIVVASFVASLITTAAQAIVTGAIMFASLIPALLATAVAALAAAWPFLLVAAIIAVVVIGIILAIQHWGQIVAWLKGVWSAFSAWFQGALKGVENFFTGIWNGIKIFFQHVWDWIVSAAKIAALVLFVVITGPIGLLALFIFAHWTEIQAWLVNAWNVLKSKASDFVNGVVNFITQLPGKVGDLLTSMRNKAMDIFNNLLQDALNFGSNIIKNVAAGITNAIHFVTGAITNVTQWISDHLPHSPAKIGPLKDLAYQGQQIVQQISEGMLLNAPKMQMAMSQVVQPVMSTVSNAVSGAPSLTGAPNISNSNSGGNVANITINYNSQAKSIQDQGNELMNYLSQQLRASGLMVNTPSGRRY